MRRISRLRRHLLSALTAFAVLWIPSPAISQDRLRVIIETDAGGDPDDEQSLVRFLLYANEWDIEGIIANRREARDRENLNSERTGLGIVKKFVSAYESVYPKLKQHSTNYPPPAQLAARTVCGYSDHDDAVNLIIAAADNPDPRPIWFLNWGTDHGSDPSNLKRALDKVLADRGREGYAKFKSRFCSVPTTYSAITPRTSNPTGRSGSSPSYRRSTAKPGTTASVLSPQPQAALTSSATSAATTARSALSIQPTPTFHKKRAIRRYFSISFQPG
jgi:hypothetical protein